VRVIVIFLAIAGNVSLRDASEILGIHAFELGPRFAGPADISGEDETAVAHPVEMEVGSAFDAWNFDVDEVVGAGVANVYVGGVGVCLGSGMVAGKGGEEGLVLVGAFVNVVDEKRDLLVGVGSTCGSVLK